MFDFTILISSICFILIDSIYLNLIKGYFSKQIATVQGSEPKINYVGAALCYLFLIIGLNYFIIKPNKSVKEAFLLGIVIYGVFETTNYALFKKWNIFTVILDTVWGGVLFAITTYIVIILRKLFKK
jgi:uncharacterized membrane protein